MAAPYSTQAIVNYNNNPPSDDGSATEANRVKWSTIKTKLNDPVKTRTDSIDAAIITAFAKVVGGGGITTTAIGYTVLAADQGKAVVGTNAGITIVTPDATSVQAPFVFGVLNLSSGDITLDGSGSQTINSAASLTMGAGDGWLLFTDGTNWFVLGRKTGVLPRGYIDGCILANGTDATNDINIAAGVCRDSTNTLDIVVTAMAGKQLDANWAPGANAGMRNSAAGIANTTYHIYAVAKPDGTQDIYAHTSTTVATVITALQAESGGSAYAYARRIGSIIRVGGAILAFTQTGDLFQWSTVKADHTAASLNTTAVLLAISVPSGIKALARLQLNSNDSDNEGVYISSPDVSDEAADVTVNANAFSLSTTRLPFETEVLTNTSAQVRGRSASGAHSLRINTKSYVDTRGRDA